MTLCGIYMLLEDLIGYKMTKSWMRFAHTQPTDELVIKGTLLQGLSENEAKETKHFYDHTLNYETLSDPAIQLFCQPKEVYPLTLQQKDLLLGIKSSNDRYQMSKYLKWAEGLGVGDSVQVHVKSILYPVQVIIRYIGGLREEAGTKFGVEMMVSCLTVILQSTMTVV